MHQEAKQAKFLRASPQHNCRATLVCEACLADVQGVVTELHLAKTMNNQFTVSCQLPQKPPRSRSGAAESCSCSSQQSKFVRTCSTSVRSPPSAVQHQSTCARSLAQQIPVVGRMARNSRLVGRRRREGSLEDIGNLFQADSLRPGNIAHAFGAKRYTCKAYNQSQMR